MINIGEYDDQDLWCGVFQGGGARGAAYPGALLALHARHQWFTAVAGSSAGAITAALVAACLDPADILEQTPRLLATIQPDGPVDRIVHTLGWRHAVRYDSSHLETALDQLLRRSMAQHSSIDGSDRGDPVSFAELYAATEVRLYVIVGDASTGVPIPFCVETTPHLGVAAAVVASCAIPVVFAPRYAAVDTTDFGGLGGPVLRRLQDGGLWANFPAFTFTDQAFRSYHGLAPNLPGRVLGFTLMYNLTLPTRIDRFVDVTRHDRDLAHTLSAPPDPHTRAVRPLTAALTMVKRSLIPLICLLSAVLLLLTEPTRPELLLPAAVLVLVGVIGVGTLSWRLANLVIPNTPVAVGGLFAGYAWVLAITGSGDQVAAVIVAVSALLLIMSGLLLHRVLERTTVGLHGLITIITGQTIRPAPWVDQLPGSRLIYVQTGDLDMLSFDAAAHTIHDAVHAAHRSCTIQLDRILTGQPNDILSRVAAAPPSALNGQQQPSSHRVLTARELTARTTRAGAQPSLHKHLKWHWSRAGHGGAMTMITIFTYPVSGAELAADRLSWVPVSTAAIDDLAVVDWPDCDDRPSAWQATPTGGQRHHLTGAFWGLLFGHLFLLPITHDPHADTKAATSGAVEEPLAHLGLTSDRLTVVRDAVVPGSSAVFVLHADDQAEKVAAAIGRRRRPAVTIALSPSQSSRLYLGFGEPSTAAAG